MSTINEEKVNSLPKEGVHCFAANGKQIMNRRIITIPLMVVSAFLACYFLFIAKTMNIPFAVIACLVFIISLLVFIQSFLIAKFRIAVDYKEKKIVLRYRYSLITIPFENFDAREGEPDKAEALIDNSALGSKDKVYYLVLDNVLDDACYQTTTKDLASREDFFKLQTEVFAIAEAYGARNLENAIKPETMHMSSGKAETTDDDIDDIVNAVMKEEAEKKKS
ncbi:MAG: hypothetical protein MJ166_00135 [Clostridia bacterium]|nr:hypothetical protein [Clostridia bacterium]